MKHQKGSTIRVRSDLHVGDILGGYRWIVGMSAYAGKEMKVEEVWEDAYYLEGSYFLFTDQMLEE